LLISNDIIIGSTTKGQLLLSYDISFLQGKHC